MLDSLSGCVGKGDFNKRKGSLKPDFWVFRLPICLQDAAGYTTPCANMASATLRKPAMFAPFT